MPAAGDIGLCKNISMGLYGEIPKKKIVTSKSVLSPREKAFPGTNCRLAAFFFVW
jgi:hypothetical protein